MTIADIKKNTESKMAQSIAALQAHLSKIRTGRANPALLESVMVDYYGNPTPLPQTASVTVEDARTLIVTAWDRGMSDAVEKAIRDSNLGLNPSAAGTVIRVPLPPLTEERRRDILKVVRQDAENAKVAVRNVRRDVLQDVKEALKEKLISQDDERRAQDEIQKLTDRFVAEIDQHTAAKEKEILQV